jgi:hypothetical protein
MPAESSEATGPADSLAPLTAAGATSDKIVGLFKAGGEFAWRQSDVFRPHRHRCGRANEVTSLNFRSQVGGLIVIPDRHHDSDDQSENRPSAKLFRSFTWPLALCNSRSAACAQTAPRDRSQVQLKSCLRKGVVRTRLPVAWKIALPIAGPIGPTGGSPISLKRGLLDSPPK